MKGKEIWLPESETKVTISDGEVTVWDEMKMTLKPLSPPIGFAGAGGDAETPMTPLFRHARRR